MAMSEQHKALLDKYVQSVDIEAIPLKQMEKRVTVAFKTNVQVNGEEWSQLKVLFEDCGNGINIGGQMPLITNPRQTHSVSEVLHAHRLSKLEAIKDALSPQAELPPRGDGVTDLSYVGAIESANRGVEL